MTTANVHQAKTNLSKLLTAAAEGEEVVITRRGGAVTRFALRPLESPKRPDLFGALKDQVVFSPDYDQADAEILEMFEESLNEPDDE